MSKGTLIRSNTLRERIEDPDHPTTMVDIANSIQAEEREARWMSRGANRKPFPKSVCADSLTGAHHFVYPPAGKRGVPRCKHCREKS